MRGRQTMLGLSALLLAVTAGGQECWTNTAGHAFSGKLVAVTDTHATFVMPTGETNTLMLGALCPASRTMARGRYHMTAIPNQLKPTFDICQKDLERLADLRQDGRLDEKEFGEAREAILQGFRTMCRKHRLPDDQYPALRARLLASVDSN